MKREQGELLEAMASLVMLELTSREAEVLGRELEAALGAVPRVEGCADGEDCPDPEGISGNEALQAQEAAEPIREDSPGSSLPLSQVLRNAPGVHGPFITLPRVLE